MWTMFWILRAHFFHILERNLFYSKSTRALFHLKTFPCKGWGVPIKSWRQNLNNFQFLILSFVFFIPSLTIKPMNTRKCVHLEYEDKHIELNAYRICLFNENGWPCEFLVIISFNSGVNTIVSLHSFELKLNNFTNTANNPYAYCVRMFVCETRISIFESKMCEQTFSIRKSHRMYSSNDHHETKRCIFYCDGKGVWVRASERDF